MNARWTTRSCSLWIVAVAFAVAAASRESVAAATRSPAPSPVPVAGFPDSVARSDAARSRQRFDDPRRWSRLWDDPERDGWQEPHRVVDLLRIRPGMRVADIGAGTGYFEHWLARAVGPHGIVYAADVESTMVAFLAARAIREATPNVIAVQAAPGDPRLPPGLLDRVLIADTYRYLDERVGYFSRLRTRLGPDALVAIVEWKSGQLPRGPAPGEKIAAESVMDEMRRAGYAVVERAELRYQDVLLFRPATAAPPRPAGTVSP